MKYKYIEESFLCQEYKLKKGFQNIDALQDISFFSIIMDKDKNLYFIEATFDEEDGELPRYLSPDGEWVGYREARHWATDHEAARFLEKYIEKTIEEAS